MEEIISLVVANGLWAVLFCGLLVYELRDSRTREKNYNNTIRALADRLKAVADVKAETSDIKTDTQNILGDTAEIKRAVVRGGRGGKCAAIEA